MNGLISDGEYRRIVLFFDIYSMTLLAIEDLTRTPRAPVIISTNSTANNTEGKSPEAQSNGTTLSQGSNNASAPALTPEDLKNKATVAKTIQNILCNYYKAKEAMQGDEPKPTSAPIIPKAPFTCDYSEASSAPIRP